MPIAPDRIGGSLLAAPALRGILIQPLPIRFRGWLERPHPSLGSGSRHRTPRRRPLEFRAVRDSTARRLSRLHALLYRLTGGVVGRRLVRNDMLLLTTRGFATGKPHTVPLLYLHDSDALVVIASWGGRPDNPDWYRNLAREPRATVHVRRKRWAVRARTATVRERALWWPRIVAAYPGYRTYQSRTDRVIPVVFLEPASSLPPQ